MRLDVNRNFAGRAALKRILKHTRSPFVTVVLEACVLIVAAQCRRVVQVGTKVRGGEARIDLAAHSRSVTGRSSEVYG
jgi:hypothetical protein